MYVQVRFELMYGSKISYLTVHLHEKAWQDASFDMTPEQEEESDGRTWKRCTFKQEEGSDDVRNTRCTLENPRKWMKNHGLSKNVMFLLCLDCIMCETRSISYNKVVPPSYQLSTLFSQFLLGLLGSYPQNTVACSSYNLRNMVEYKDRCQVIIFLFLTFYSCDVICWLEDRNCAKVALEPMGRWPCHCLGNNSWTLKGTLGVL